MPNPSLDNNALCLLYTEITPRLSQCEHIPFAQWYFLFFVTSWDCLVHLMTFDAGIKLNGKTKTPLLNLIHTHYIALDITVEDIFTFFNHQSFHVCVWAVSVLVSLGSAHHVWDITMYRDYKNGGADPNGIRSKTAPGRLRDKKRKGRIRKQNVMLGIPGAGIQYSNVIYNYMTCIIFCFRLI